MTRQVCTLYRSISHLAW